MKYAYISVGQCDAVEQELVADIATRDSILKDMVQALDGNQSIESCAVLAAIMFNPPDGIDLPFYWTEVGERKEGEIVIISRRMREMEEKDIQPDSWIVVVRPLQGIVSSTRLDNFVDELDTLPEDCGHAVSTLPLPGNANPFWNTSFFDLGRFSYTGWRMPARSAWQFENVDTLCPKLKETMRGIDAVGSQFLPDLHIYDEALYAFKASFLQDELGLELPEPTPIAGVCGDTMLEKLYCRSAPVFLLDKSREFDLSSYCDVSSPENEDIEMRSNDMSS